METALSVDSLIKNYGSNRVIKSITFSVNRGEIFALLGTNGAGKTTTLECIEGLRKYESGKITVEGKLGVQLQSSSLPETIRAQEAISLFCKWKKAAVSRETLDSLGLENLKNKQYRQMSTGQKRRLHLALALIGSPDILFLDEPTAGLDVEGRVGLHEEIRKLRQQGRTIVMASHDMAEVESLCDRIAILKNGKIAFLGTAGDLTAKASARAQIYLKMSAIPVTNDFSACSYEGEKQGYSLFTAENLSDALLELLTTAKERQIDISDVKIERGNLEQSFMDIAREDQK